MTADPADDRDLLLAPADRLVAEVERLRQALAEAERKIAELETRADVDPLLDILNRRGFERELSRSLAYVQRYGTPAALMFIDLDGFKAVNDLHGHAAGDALLKAVASGLRANVRASDVVARLGGDEFGVLMWNVDADRAAAKATDLETLIANVRADHGPASLSVGASAGAVPLSPGAGVAAVIDAADKAMYARKKGRRG
ncbi:MAG: diguanylate cyclase [Pseudolabrys sp.]|nr:diguanylate cyclase [Pseudolabrys sp.]MDP2294313.1 diguanylate cyclase [Pseudolabrys sp.]